MKWFFLILISLTLWVNAFAQFTDYQKSGLNSENVFPNGGGEAGSTNWTANGGTSTKSADTTDKLAGKASIKFTSSGATDYLATAAVAIPHGQNCMIDLWYKTTSADYSINVMEGANIVATLALPANTAFQNANVSFVCAPATQYHTHIITRTI